MGLLANVQRNCAGRRGGKLPHGLLLLLAGGGPVWGAPHVPGPEPSPARAIAVGNRLDHSTSTSRFATLSVSGARQTTAPLTLLEAATAADPLVTAEDRKRFGVMARRRLAEAQAGGNIAGDPLQTARGAFAFLHGRILVGRFEPTCARVHVTLADGTFNCLTATYWYLALCRASGLTAAAVAAPNHVAVRLWIDGDAWDVETTDPEWNPRLSRPGDPAVRELSDNELLARVHYNLGIEFAEADRFEFALMATRRSCQLDPAHLDARANLLATINNWSLTLAERGEYDRAEAILREGLAIEPTSAALRRSDAYLRQQRRAASQ